MLTTTVSVLVVFASVLSHINVYADGRTYYLKSSVNLACGISVGRNTAKIHRYTLYLN